LYGKGEIAMTLNVKPVYVHLVHRSAYMGPCRSGKDKQLERSYDEMMAAENFQNMQEKLQELYKNEEGICLQKPVYLPFLDEFIVRESELDLAKDEDTDVFLLEGLMGQHLAVNLAKKYKKPMCSVGCCTAPDVTACLRAAGMEAYGCIDLADSVSVMRMLRAKKEIANTRCLIILKGDICTKGVESNIRDLDRLTNLWGVKFKFLNAEDFLHEIDILDEAGIRQAEKIADDLIAGATEARIDRDSVIRSAKVYVVVKRLLSLYDCNAFTVPCFEICATRKLNQERYTFCLTHTLLKEDGIPSACESDYNALLSMIVLMSLAGNAPHMGNTHPALPEEIRRAWSSGTTSSRFTTRCLPGLCAVGRSRLRRTACSASQRESGAPACAITTIWTRAAP
jgi:hypothetical protein